MKTDTLFYNLFREFSGIFFELIGQSLAEGDIYQFTSVEVKQLAFRLDGLFLPTTDQENKPFYLVEVQFQADEDLYYRLFGELFLYLKQYKPPHPWRVVVIYPRRSAEREQSQQFAEMLTLNRVTRVYLNELGAETEASLGVGVAKLVIARKTAAIERARGLIAQARQELRDETVQRNLIDLIETIIVYKLPQKSREEIEVILGLDELRNTKVYQEALQEGRQEGLQEGRQEGLQEGRQEGLQEGRQEGLQEGRQEGEERGRLKGKFTAISNLLNLGLSLEQIAQALELRLEIVRKATDSQIILAAFLELLNNQTQVFSPEQLRELTQLLTPLADNDREMAQTISTWLKKYPEIHKPYQEILIIASQGEEVTTPESRINKEILQTAVERTFAN